MMAHATDDSAAADHRPTRRARSTGAIGTRACRHGTTRASAVAVGGGPQLRHDRHDDRLQFADDRLVEATPRQGLPGGIGPPPAGLEALHAHTGAGGPYKAVDEPPPAPRPDALA